jgi:hypothetical protein
MKNEDTLSAVMRLCGEAPEGCLPDNTRTQLDDRYAYASVSQTVGHVRLFVYTNPRTE